MTDDSPTTLARRFLDACAEIEQVLKQRYRLEAKTLGTIVRDVEPKDRVVRQNRGALLAFVELRNLLAHRPFHDGSPFAAPLQRTVDAVERLRDEIARPQLALSLATRDVLTSSEDLPLPGLLRAMAAGDISQVPVYGTGEVRLLTTNAIARWLADHIEPDGTALIEECTTADALAHAEPHERIKLVARTATAAAALDQLTRSDPPAAVLITETGRSGEMPLGILAAADTARLVTALTVEAY